MRFEAALRGGSRRIAALGGRSGRKVHGGRSRKVRGGSGRMHVVAFGGRSGRKLHGRSRKLRGGRQPNAFGF
jgi:hypothetical protein